MLRQQINPVALISRIKSSQEEPVFPDSGLLDQVVAHMHEQEAKKYPPGFFSYTRGKLEHEGESLSYVYTTYNGKSLNPEQAQQAQVAAIRLRKLSLLAGVIYALDLPSFLSCDESNRKQLLDTLSTWMQRILAAPEDASPKSVNQFVDEFVDHISAITQHPFNEVIRQMRLAERYFVAEYQADVFLNEILGQKQVHAQLSVSLKNSLQQSQMKEWVRIHSDKKPAWFLRLSSWEQQWFYQRVPTLYADKAGWGRFQRYFKSSAMSHIPGISNLRRTYVLNDQAVISDSLQLGTLVAYEMPKYQQAEDTKRSVRQLMQFLGSRAQEKKSRMWPSINLKPMVLIQSILSDTIGGDGELVKGQRQAIEAEKALYADDYEIVHGNDPVNFLRLFAAESGVFSRHYTKRWDHTLTVLAYANRFVALADQSPLSPEQSDKLAFIKLLKKELEWMRNATHLTGIGRNFNAYKVAMTELLVEAMGGQVSVNCKSGKDRTGFASLYKQAIYSYYQEYQILPHYNDKGRDRDNFIQIFKKLFDAQRAQELAAWNTPGSFGLKDSAKMLCLDIAKTLKHGYQQSNYLADMNKPSVIKKDEMQEVAEIRKIKPVLVVKENYINQPSNQLLGYAHVLKKSCPTWEAKEHYQADKNELTKIDFSKRLPSGMQATFTATNAQISTFDYHEMVFTQMLKTFSAVYPKDKGVVLSVLNQDVANIATAICRKMGIKHQVVVQENQNVSNMETSSDLDNTPRFRR